MGAGVGDTAATRARQGMEHILIIEEQRAVGRI